MGRVAFQGRQRDLHDRCVRLGSALLLVDTSATHRPRAGSDCRSGGGREQPDVPIEATSPATQVTALLPEARIYGGVLQVDPVEGGCSNDYVYVSDPISEYDLAGLACPRWLKTTSSFLSWTWVPKGLYRALQGDGKGAKEAVIGGGNAIASTTGTGAALDAASRPAGRHSRPSAMKGFLGKLGWGLGRLGGTAVGGVATVVDWSCSGPDPVRGGRGAPPAGPTPPTRIDVIVYNNGP